MLPIELHENEASRAMVNDNSNGSCQDSLVFGISFLTEDTPGNSLDGGDPNRLNNSELKFWLMCRGDWWKGFSTKGQLCKR